MKWKTSISKADDTGNTIRGYDLNELIEKLSFSEMIYLILLGEMPHGQEAKMLDAILVACTEHSIAPPSIISARTAVSSGNPFTVGIAAGILSIGEHHGGAVEQSARIFQENTLPAEDFARRMKEEGKRIPGYGHKIYTTDPRTTELMKLAEKYNVRGKHCLFAEELEKALEKTSGRKLCLNIDGAVAAIMSDMKFDWRLGKGLFAIGRTVGIVAHTHEEMTREKPYRRVEDSDIEYDGPEPRSMK